jgi:hypothetical protein
VFRETIRNHSTECVVLRTAQEPQSAGSFLSLRHLPSGINLNFSVTYTFSINEAQKGLVTVGCCICFEFRQPGIDLLRRDLGGDPCTHFFAHDAGFAFVVSNAVVANTRILQRVINQRGDLTGAYSIGLLFYTVRS